MKSFLATKLERPPQPPIRSSSMDVNCADCDQPISGRAVFAEDRVFHRGHFRCGRCQLALRHVYALDDTGMPVCMACQGAQHPACHKCREPVGETFLRTADERIFHLECFVCAGCGRPFPGGEYRVAEGLPFDTDCFWARILTHNSAEQQQQQE